MNSYNRVRRRLQNSAEFRLARAKKTFYMFSFGDISKKDREYCFSVNDKLGNRCFGREFAAIFSQAIYLGTTPHTPRILRRLTEFLNVLTVRVGKTLR